MAYENLLSPITVNGMTVRNRIMMTPMGTNFANPDGSMSDEHKRYYELRAKGGTGLIIVENVCVDFPLGSNGTTQLRLDHDSFIPHLYELTERVHSRGAVIAVQINHAGASAKESRIGMQPASASDIPSKKGAPAPRPLTREEIYRLVECYGDSAKRAQMAGFDAVEIHAGHSYLLNQFISPLTNHRTDEFGGSVENRTRFLKLVLEDVRKKVGPRYPIIIRISSEEFVEGGNTLADTLEWLPLVDEYVDLYDVSAGLNDSMELMIDKASLPDGWRSYMPKAVKEKFGKPVISTGNYRDPKVCEAVLARGDADIIGIGRGLIADPEWVNKVSTGREEDIRKCISCCIGCTGNRMFWNRPIRCTINPAVTEGDGYKSRRVSKPCKVVVIGAGTAGLEAACTAAEVGCDVTLLEKGDHLGGRAASICNLPEKFRMKDFVTYLTRRASQLANLHIRLNTEATTELVSSLAPDLIVCTTGSEILTPPIPGLLENLEKGNILTADGVIANVLSGAYDADLSGKKCVVIGGGATGLDIIETFANKNASCTVVEMMPVIGRDLTPIAKSNITNLIREKHICEMPSTKLLEVRANSFVTDAGELPFDIGVICLGLKAYRPLAEAMEKIAHTVCIGDAKQSPRQIIDGVREGRDILKTLETEGFLN